MEAAAGTTTMQRKSSGLSPVPDAMRCEGDTLIAQFETAKLPSSDVIRRGREFQSNDTTKHRHHICPPQVLYNL
uniref:Uncharacterized protein n=1 Tax=Angiostrongylus cantonensis TaxID=6313 RepID=A0A0K0D009_ANGCA